MVKIITQNRRAYYDYFIEEKFEAGLVLKGTEVKSLRLGKGRIEEAHVFIRDQEAWLQNFNIPHYEFGNRYNFPETRQRKLLLKKDQIITIHHALKAKGQSLIPLKVYFKNSWAKVELGLAKGKKKHDKRESEKKKQAQREMARYES